MPKKFDQTAFDELFASRDFLHFDAAYSLWSRRLGIAARQKPEVQRRD
jgi:hypothetical protein